MADGDSRSEHPSLELPKLGRRRGRTRATDPVVPVVPADPVEQADPAEPVEPVEPAPKPRRERTRRPPRAARAPRAPREPREPRELGPGGMPVAVLTGAVVGLGIVGLTWASLRGCEAVQGTSSCGDVGYLLLTAILVVMVIVGRLLLRTMRVPEPGTTSFLGVGLTAVAALLFLVDSLMDNAMVVVLPLLCAAAFAAAHWVTRTFIEPVSD